MICYKEYKLINNDSFNKIKTELRQLNTELEVNNRILSNLAESISYISKESQSKVKTCNNSWCENEL